MTPIGLQFFGKHPMHPDKPAHYRMLLWQDMLPGQVQFVISDAKIPEGTDNLVHWDELPDTNPLKRRARSKQFRAAEQILREPGEEAPF